MGWWWRTIISIFASRRCFDNRLFAGHIGFIHEVIYEHYLKAHPAPEECEYYLCGPPMMNAAVIHMLHELGVEEENILLDDFGVGGR